jgi:hypothetical protein
VSSVPLPHPGVQIPGPVWDALYCRPRLTRTELQVVSVVIGETVRSARGRPREWTRPLPVSELVVLTGRPSQSIARSLRQLVRQGILVERGQRYRLTAEAASWTLPSGRRTAVSPQALVRNIPSHHTPTFTRLITGFAGPFTTAQQAHLKAWVEAVGVAGAWGALEPWVRLGPQPARAYLRAVLKRRGGSHPA